MLPYNHNITGTNKAHSGLHSVILRNSPNVFAETPRDSRTPQQKHLSNPLTRGHRDGSGSSYDRDVSNNYKHLMLRGHAYPGNPHSEYHGEDTQGPVQHSTAELLRGTHDSSHIERQLGQSTQTPAVGSLRGYATNNIKHNIKI